jgi:hypothetical protein
MNEPKKLIALKPFKHEPQTGGRYGLFTVDHGQVNYYGEINFHFYYETTTLKPK